MSVLSKSFISEKEFKATKKAKSFTPIGKRYMDYAARQANEKVLWYMNAIIVIPCVVMVPSIFLMAMATTNYLWFIGLCMLLFFANVVAHIAEYKSTFYVPLYHASIAVMILIPIINYLFSL